MKEENKNKHDRKRQDAIRRQDRDKFRVPKREPYKREKANIDPRNYNYEYDDV